MKHNSLKSVKSLVYLVFNRRFDSGNSIISKLEARGGSTWLAEVIIKIHDSILTFEPLRRRRGKFRYISQYFSYPFYLGTKESDSILKKHVTNTMLGKSASAHTLQFNSFNALRKSNSMVIKFVSVNMIAEWFSINFKTKIKPIYLLRHPLAILNSKEHFGYNKKPIEKNADLKKFKKIKNEEHPYLEHMDYVKKLKTNYELFIFNGL